MTPPTLVRVARLDCQQGGEKTRDWHPRIPGLCPKTIPFGQKMKPLKKWKWKDNEGTTRLKSKNLPGDRDPYQAKHWGEWVGKKEKKRKRLLRSRCVVVAVACFPKQWVFPIPKTHCGTEDTTTEGSRLRICVYHAHHTLTRIIPVRVTSVGDKTSWFVMESWQLMFVRRFIFFWRSRNCY